MSDTDGLSALLLDLYACAVRPDDWAPFLMRLSAMLDASQALLIHHHLANGEFTAASIATGGDPEGLIAYNTHYGAQDPWTEGYRRRGGFKTGNVDVLPSEALVPEADLRRTEFYNDFCLRFDIAGAVSVATAPAGDASTTTMSLLRSARRPAFSDRDLAALQLIAPHLQQALAIGHRIQQADRREQDLAATLDQMTESMALLQGDGRIRFLNAAMRRLTASGSALCVQGRQLRPRSPAVNSVFQVALRGLARWREGAVATVPSAINLEPERGPAGMTLTLAPIMAPGHPAMPLVVIRVVDPVAVVLHRVAKRLEAMGLTPTEVRIVTLLAEGHSVRHIASETHTREATVRWHLKQVFAKTATRTQAQLVAFALAR